MSDPSDTVTIRNLNGHAVRSARIGESEYVSVEDFCGYLQRLVGRIGDLSHWQAEHLTRMNDTLDVLCEVLSQRDPELRNALQRAAQRRARPV